MPSRLLLDTHALIWALADPDELKTDAREAIQSPGNAVLVSPASLYEINLKVALGKMAAPSTDLLAAIDAAGFTELPLRLAHASLAGSLPFHHRDPFDRLIVAQALIEDVTVVTRDEQLTRYDVSLLPC